MTAELTKQRIPVTPVPVTGPDDGVETAVRLTRAGAVTAIMCPSGLRQLAVLRGLRSAGLSAPNDVSVSGCDGIMPGLDLMGLTTLRLPVNELARRTIDLMGRLVGEHPPPPSLNSA
jgi:DNA-binding LacI/PurR family transcriptional regulator